ncbi:ArsA family ATPase [Streptomyces sp. NPDC048172]|uniref:ArsA family ATPase n=1 Tax=Streptomyces sp. NPDC048172 TaxID=3365505 RepID=UPI0037201F52
MGGPGEPVAVRAVPGLWLARVDAGEEFRTRAAALQERGKAALDLLGTSPLDGEELTELPGAETFALLHALRHARSADWDLIVIDLPPTPHGLNALVLPEQLRRYLRRLVPPERQAARALRPLLAQLAGAPAPGPWLYEATGRWESELAVVQDIVESPHTAVRLVAEPGPLASDALRVARAGLRLHGLALEAVVANRLLPTGSADPWLASLSGQQQDVLKELRATCEAEGVPLCELPHLGRDPRGPEDLAALAGAARATASQVPDPQGPARHGWVEDRLDADGHLVWRLPMPGAERGELELVRRGDELIVGVGPYRRVLPLPSALRRCRVAGAGLRGGELRVRFRPDPDLWPSGR